MIPIKINWRATVFLVCLMTFSIPIRSKAQSHEVQQLLLNVEKLSQFKNILSDMKQGYQILNTGYNTVKSISQGNFNLHEVFIDGLMLVSPEVRKYHKVADIINYQKEIVKEYTTAFNRFKSSGTFNDQELGYLGKVYRQLFDKSVDNLDALLNVVTSSKLRMSDAERLQVIDRIFSDTQDKLIFLRDFNRKASVLHLQRLIEKNDIQTLQKLHQP